MAVKSVLLAPNVEIKAEAISYPVLASIKYDGVRAYSQDSILWSRNVKPLSRALHEKYKVFLKEAAESGLIFDCEVFSEKLDFNEIMSALAPKAFRVPNHLKLYVFDCLLTSEWGGASAPFKERAKRYQNWLATHQEFKDIVVPVEQKLVEHSAQLSELVAKAISEGHEGLMVRSLSGKYKHGRATFKEGIIYKFKDWRVMDAVIIGFTQRSRLTDEYRLSEDREYDELGHLKRTHSKDVREYVDEIGSVLVRFADGRESGATFKKGSTLRTQITWANREQFIGKPVEVEYMEHGAVHAPRFTRIIKLRTDLE